MIIRVASDIAVFLSLLVLPFWLSVPITLVFMFYFSKYFEGILAGLIIDSLYGSSVSTFLNYEIAFTLFFAAAFVVVEHLKLKLRVYESI